MKEDFVMHGSLQDVDPQLNHLLQLEDQRQDQTIILIASESMAPDSVREAMSSTFANIYAEGYPRESSRRQTEEAILDIDYELSLYRRNSDPRYYKGVEYADVLEALTRRRAAELFAANGVKANGIYVNVQPLSGAPANSAVYTALLKPGDKILGLNLNDGGHLSHGAPVSRSGQVYHSIAYFVDDQTEMLDYDAIEKQALAERPQIIVAGYSAYPRIVDWGRFRQIADKCGAYLLADIAHISGLVASGMHPSPIGIADIVTTTTHKSLCGPRGAMIMTHRADLARKIDRAVFPGEQGGPHLNTMAALAVALRLANSDKFRQLQARIVHNATRLAQKLEAQGLRIVGGGSENHVMLVDTKSVSHHGVQLSGDLAARILDVAGIVVNRNTIPGDKGAFNPTGLRLGTVWISQLGFGDAEIDLLAEAIGTVLNGCKPYYYPGKGNKKLLRAKVTFAALQRGREIVRQLRGFEPSAPVGNVLDITGKVATRFLHYALTSDVLSLVDGESQTTHVVGEGGLNTHGLLHRLSSTHYQLYLPDEAVAGQTAVWFSDLSDAYVQFDDDIYARLPGAVVVKTMANPTGTEVGQPDPSAFIDSKPFFVGQGQRPSGDALPAFTWQEPKDAPLKTTALHSTHQALGAKMVPFAGYDMPVWYSSVSEEHQAVRRTAGLFDVTHMGVFEVSGVHATEFLNTVTTNDVYSLSIGQSQYTYLLFPDGSVVDDLLIYRLERDNYMMVVNAANNDKNWAWLNAINNGEVLIDEERPFSRLTNPVTLRDLRNPASGADQRLDIALQGPNAQKILLALCDDDTLAGKIKRLSWARLVQGNVGGFDLIISRTGYTGERVAYELFVHPDQAVAFWNKLLEAGEQFGLQPCGLAARDSTRTEAGLPLYGHELAGALNLNPGHAGFRTYVKIWKPFFIGRKPYIAEEMQRESIVVRFRMDDKGVRRPETGDPILDKRGKIIGTVTSCAIDKDGYLLGLALVPINMRKRGNTLRIYQLGGGTRELRSPKTIKMGARMPLPDTATVISRFP